MDGWAMFDAIGVTNQIKTHLTERDAIAIARLFGKLDSVVRQDRVNLVGHRFQQVLKELPRGFAICLLDQLRDCELAGSINSVHFLRKCHVHKEIELAFLRPDLGEVDVKIPNRIALELLPFGFGPVHIR